MQPLVVMPGNGVTLCRVEAVDDGEPLVDGDLVGIRWLFQLLAEDVMEEVQVVADEEQQQGFSQELRRRWGRRPMKGPGALLSFQGKMRCRHWLPCWWN